MDFRNNKILKKAIYILFLSIYFFLFSTISFAQVAISTPDIAIPRGVVSQIPVSASLNISAINSITIGFSYDSRIIDIKSASGNPAYIITELTPSTTTTFPRLDSAYTEITSSSLQLLKNGTLFMLNVEGLVFSDSITHLKLEKLVINDSVYNSNYSQGTIKVLGEPYLSHLPDAIGQCIPNPFVTQSTFYFSLENDSKVKFMIYNTVGRLVSTSDENDNYMFTAFNLESQGNPIKSFDNILTRGNYKLMFSPPPWLFAQGLYIMFMQTGKGVYKTNFMYFKQ